MLKREITYEDFNGEKQTETFYFNISKSELIELEVDVQGGFGKYLQNIVEAEDQRRLVHEFKRIVLMAYGQKSADGKQFVKSDAMRQAFAQTAAYQTLFMELATDDKAATAFIKGVIPSDVVPPEQDKPVGPPPIPKTLNQ